LSQLGPLATSDRESISTNFRKSSENHFSQNRFSGGLTVGGKVAKNDIRRHERPQLAPTGPIVTSVVDFRNFPPDGQPPEIARQAFFASQAFSKIAEVRRFSGSSETMLLYVFY